MMSRHYSRRDVFLGIGLTILVPGVARAVLPIGAPERYTLDVFDMAAFDPNLRRDAEGRVVRNNLAFRMLALDTPRAIRLLDEISGSVLGDLTFLWETGRGPQSLVMFSAKVVAWQYVALAQQGRGQNYDEFVVGAESTHGTLRRREAEQTLVADYRITPNGGVLWNRYTA